MSRQRRQVPMEHRPRPTDALKLSGRENTRGTYGLNLKGSVSRSGFRGLCRAADLVASPYGHHVVATQREIVKAGGVSVPPGHVNRIASHDMRCGTHLDPALALRAVEQRHFQLDRGTRRNDPRRQEINPAGADV